MSTEIEPAALINQLRTELAEVSFRAIQYKVALDAERSRVAEVEAVNREILDRLPAITDAAGISREELGRLLDTDPRFLTDKTVADDFTAFDDEPEEAATG